MVRSGSALCLEVERGLRVIEIMYSKLDETIVEAQVIHALQLLKYSIAVSNVFDLSILETL